MIFEAFCPCLHLGGGVADAGIARASYITTVTAQNGSTQSMDSSKELVKPHCRSLNSCHDVCTFWKPWYVPLLSYLGSLLHHFFKNWAFLKKIQIINPCMNCITFSPKLSDQVFLFEPKMVIPSEQHRSHAGRSWCVLSFCEIYE
jgi:hypothetical protein